MQDQQDPAAWISGTRLILTLFLMVGAKTLKAVEMQRDRGDTIRWVMKSWRSKSRARLAHSRVPRSVRSGSRS